ncbi:MAG: PQQ-binding-like beta-propeller repeat protein [Limisphaerales bacterium]
MKRFLSVACGCLFALVATAENWPQWRGPTGDGVSRETGLPMTWDDETNVRWKTPLPGEGNSTPVVWGNKIFLAQAAEEERLLMCFARSNGKLMWKRGVKHSAEEISHKTNPKASSSPATDGERVVVSFSSGGVHCFDMNGKPLWKRDLGKQAHIWGYGASPAIIGDLVYLNFGPGERTFLIAMNKRTGETVWKSDEPGGGFGNKVPGKSGREIWIGSWSTPIQREVSGRDELIMTWPHRVVGLDPLTGKEFWECEGLNPLVYTSPIYSDGVVVAMGGYSGSAIGVRAGGTGDVTDTHRLWRHPKTKQRIGSAVIHEAHIYIHNDPGVAECIELKTGKRVWEERLKGSGASGRNWSSMILSDGKLYVNNWSGETFILAASPKFKILGVNSIKEKTIGSIAVSNGELFIRGYKHLWCIGDN